MKSEVNETQTAHIPSSGLPKTSELKAAPSDPNADRFNCPTDYETVGETLRHITGLKSYQCPQPKPLSNWQGRQTAVQLWWLFLRCVDLISPYRVEPINKTVEV